MSINHNSKLIEKLNNQYRDLIQNEINVKMPLKSSVLNDLFKEYKDKIMCE